MHLFATESALTLLSWICSSSPSPSFQFLWGYLLDETMKESKANLAVSLNATTDEVRNWIMPINRKYDLEELLGTLRKCVPKRDDGKAVKKVRTFVHLVVPWRLSAARHNEVKDTGQRGRLQRTT